MKEEILSAIRPFVFGSVAAKVSAMLDQYRSSIEGEKKPVVRDAAFADDQVQHLLKALSMISKVPSTADGAIMAKGIAGDAISAASSTDD